MAEDTGAKCRVLFPAEKVKTTVSRGKTVLEACVLAGLEIDAVCGGEGKCGRCRVKPSGIYTSKE